ncbi:MAG: 30S ribosomal protein S4 [Actinobacteria bacterium]|nr:30S ribosomal protein S4 [Actinomycetota bacterium]MBU4482912.1 30S ribosomal protein S4 [Actinomycetota bacterium]
MAVAKGPACKQCRRERVKLFLKGQRCFSDKCVLEKKPYVPGQRAKRRLMETDYSAQLREKQKAKRYYGVWERQFKNYYKKAVKRKGVTGEILLQLLETRLDNIVYVMGFAASRVQARQLINHGHIQVNGRKVDKPSYQLKEGQEISVAESSKEIIPIMEAKESGGSLTMPEWLEVDLDNLKGKLVRYPKRDEIRVPVNEQIIVELYSK